MLSFWGISYEKMMLGRIVTQRIKGKLLNKDAFQRLGLSRSRVNDDFAQ